MKPALTTLGKTATHSALANKSEGIPLSGAPMISVKTLADFDACFAPSFVLGPLIGGSTGCVGAVAVLLLVFDLLPCAIAVPAIASTSKSTMVHRTVCSFMSPFLC